MVFHPCDDGYDEMFFNCPKIGKYNEPMRPMNRTFSWMSSKYGRDVMPWEIHFEFVNEEGELGQLASSEDAMIRYNYSRRNKYTG